MSPNRALFITERQQKKLGLPRNVEPYEPGEGEVVIRNESVAQNPVDCQQVDFDFWLPYLPFINGCDTAGVVVSIAPGVPGLILGDRVCCMTICGKEARYGTYQTHSIAKAFAVVKIPDTLSFDNATTFPVAYYTAATGLFYDLQIPLPVDSPTSQNKGAEPILVWGASSSVGAMAVQLAALAGFKVIATASTKNFAYVKALGATELVNYKDPDAIPKIKVLAPTLKLAYDAVCTSGSTESIIACMPCGGTIATVEIFDGAPADVTIHFINAQKNYSDDAVNYALTGLFRTLLHAQKLQPHPVKVIPNGLASVDEGWQFMRDGKVSGQKLVYHPQEG